MQSYKIIYAMASITYLEDYINELTQEQLTEKLSALKHVTDKYIEELEKKQALIQQAQDNNPDNPKLTEEIEKGLRQELSDMIYNELSQNGLVTREIQMDLLNNKLSRTYDGNSGHYSKLKNQLEQSIKRLDAKIEPIQVKTGFIEERLSDMTYNELQGARKVLDETFMNFLSTPDNLKNQAELKQLVEKLDENGLLSPSILEAYAQGNASGILRAKDGLMSKIDRELSGLEQKLQEHYGRERKDNRGISLIARAIIALIHSVQDGFPKKAPEDPRIRTAYAQDAIKKPRRTLLPVWLYFLIPYGIPILAGEMLTYKLTGYDRRVAANARMESALAESKDLKGTYLKSLERLKTVARQYVPEQSQERRNRLTEKAKKREQEQSINIDNVQQKKQAGPTYAR